MPCSNALVHAHSVSVAIIAEQVQILSDLDAHLFTKIEVVMPEAFDLALTRVVLVDRFSSLVCEAENPGLPDQLALGNCKLVEPSVELLQPTEELLPEVVLEQ